MTAEERVFVDTNVLVYALSAADPKSLIAEALIAQCPTLSVQVINEGVSVQTKKLRRPMSDALRVATYLMQRCQVVSLTVADVELSHDLIENHQFSMWDSLIVASALNSDCAVLYSEDMQHGRVVRGRLTIQNPFFSVTSQPEVSPAK